jgi:hypothetical protein
MTSLNLIFKRSISLIKSSTIKPYRSSSTICTIGQIKASAEASAKHSALPHPLIQYNHTQQTNRTNRRLYTTSTRHTHQSYTQTPNLNPLNPLKTSLQIRPLSSTSSSSTSTQTTPTVPPVLPVKSLYISRSIDLARVYQSVFGEGYVHRFGAGEKEGSHLVTKNFRRGLRFTQRSVIPLVGF